MPDWSSPLEMQRGFDVAIALAWLSVGLALYDHVRTLRFDWAIITGKRAQRWPQIVFLSLKVFWWLYIGVSFKTVFYPSSAIDCLSMFYFVEFLMGAVIICCSILLACRTIVVFQDRQRALVSGIVTVLTLGLTAAWMIGVPDIKAKWIDGAGRDYQQGACVFIEVPPRYGVKYAVTIAYDFIILCMTVFGVLRMNTSSRIGDVLISQGILYFLASLVVNAVVTGLTLAQLNPVMSVIAAIPSSCVSMIAATRLYIELTEEGRGARIIDSREHAERSWKFSASALRKRLTSTASSSSNEKHRSQLPTVVSDGDASFSSSGSSKPAYAASYDASSSAGAAPVCLLSSRPADRQNSVFGAEIGGISINEETTVEVEELPAHFRGRHFLSASQMARVNGMDSAENDAVQTAFAGLAAQQPKNEQA